MRPLLFITFIQGFQISKFFGHPTLGNGGKIRLNGTKIVNGRTDKQTHRHTDGHFNLYKALAQRADALKMQKKHLKRLNLTLKPYSLFPTPPPL